MRRIYSQFVRIIGSVSLSAILASAAFTQSGTRPGDEGMGIGFYFFCLVVAAGIIGGLFLWKKKKAGFGEISQADYNYQMSYNHGVGGSYHMDGVDAERDLEWLRKAKKVTRKRETPGQGPSPVRPGPSTTSASEAGIETRAFQEKMRKLQYAQLPINSFSQLAQAKTYIPLECSDDHSLLTAIEQANEEFEEDESVRDLAVRILTAFRTRNSVEALSQIALYDLSSSLRSKAVTVLADFDHESVFETLLLACADPTREVRAAAARGLFRLSFDRAHAWKRIIEANDDFRMSHAARAAVESGIVAKSLDRLIHEDLKIAYEAFSLVSLLIKAGETDTVFEALRDHKDDRVKYALLHVLKVHREPRTLSRLNDLRVGRSWPTDLSDRMRDTVKSLEQVTT
ncbi:MAG: HEAT repeat domain-containing protein [Pyrinomonadaceae bacterium]